MPKITVAPQRPKLTNRGAAGLLGKKIGKVTSTIQVPKIELPPIVVNKIAKSLLAMVVEIDSLTPDPVNARLHPERNMEAIKQSLIMYGQVKPIVVREETGVVMAGNGTLAAAKELGWTEIAVSMVSMNEVEAAGYGLADNRTAELAKWDFEVVARLDKLLIQARHAQVGWSGDELEVLRMTDWTAPEIPANLEPQEPQPEDIEQLPGDAELLMKLKVTIEEPKSIVVSGEVYKLGKHTLVISDVVEDWANWKDYLKEGTLFCPYPGPLVFLTTKAAKGPILGVQPDCYISGHILDNYKAIHGEKGVRLV